MNNNINFKKNKGISFIEVLLSLVILAIGVVGILYLYSFVTRNALSTDQSLVAINLAREKIEQITADRANKGYTLVAITRGDSYYSEEGPISAPYNMYSRYVQFQFIDPPAGPGGDFSTIYPTDLGYLKIKVTVTWNQGADSVSLASIISNWSS